MIAEAILNQEIEVTVANQKQYNKEIRNNPSLLFSDYFGNIGFWGLTVGTIKKVGRKFVIEK